MGEAMTHDELLYRMIWASERYHDTDGRAQYFDALRAVVELHKPVEHTEGTWCSGCMATEWYPCPTIQAIEKELA
jgi:hypothetical protein